MMNTCIDLLEEILEGQNQGKPKAIGFDYRALNKQQQNQDKKFFPVVGTYDTTMSKPMSQHPKEHQSSKSKGISRPLRCHNCGRCGHIRPYCYKLYGYPQPHVQPKANGKIVQAKKEWNPKTPNARKRKTPNVSSSVTFSTSIGVPYVLIKSGNLVKSVHNVYKPHSMSRLYVEHLQNPNEKSQSKMVPDNDNVEEATDSSYDAS